MSSDSAANGLERRLLVYIVPPFEVLDRTMDAYRDVKQQLSKSRRRLNIYRGRYLAHI